MRTSTLLSASFVVALLSAMASVGCSEPDVQAFDGSGADRAAGGDDDDDTTAPKKKTTTTKKPTTTTKPDPTTTTKPATTTPSTTPTTPAGGTTTTTPAACFTHCVAPVPEAVELDACSSKCADGDSTCLSGCYDSSNCGANPQCDQAVDQCNAKCFP